MKIYKEKTTTAVQRKIEVAYRLVEDEEKEGDIDIEMVVEETGKHITWLASLTPNGIRVHGFSEPDKDDYNYDEDMFSRHQLLVRYDDDEE